ncbi:site-specific integrase [Deinococcus yavapaiensis]|uniref:Phage integrase family protein n=1 Tax=Deinococcus yavapaiensis KR-236 TaxID=694435 RepID=A0A318RZV3_9DEIO|nr:site-specific integrase [Deinococcus yavapaiensis]PYE47700.1 phage integrase family protein [Deinococcus yavapaiensis KR-236]
MARGHRQFALFATIAALGLRHGEALGLQWNDLTWDDRGKVGTLAVQRSVVTQDNKPVITTPKTSASFRTLYFDADLWAILREHRFQLITRGLNASERGWVFPSLAGTTQSQHNVRRDWRSILTEAGLDTTMRIQGLQHTFVSRLIESGADPRVAADVEGHSDPCITLARYAHSQAEKRKQTLLAALL